MNIGAGIIQPYQFDVSRINNGYVFMIPNSFYRKKEILLIILIFVISANKVFSQCVLKPNDKSFIDHQYYSFSYIEPYEQSDWVCYRLTREMLYGVAQRNDNFKEDKRVPTGSASKADYLNSGYDRGHLAPAADFKFNQVAMDQSFYFSNISPQAPGFNRGIWKKLEDLTREWAKKYRSIDITTGPIFDGYDVIGRNKVRVPSHFYKAVVRKTALGYEGIAFILSNKSSSSDIQSFIVSIDDLEERLNIDLYASLDDSDENTLEALVDTEQWIWNTNKSKVNSATINTSTKTTSPTTIKTQKSSTLPRRTVSVQCKGKTKKGNRCRNKTLNGSGYCYLHDG